MMSGIEETQRQLLQKIHTEGVREAYDAALSVCRDPKAPAPARASAAATLFRVAGYFDRKSDSGREKEPHEMTPEELDRAVRRAQRQLQAASSVDESIFD